MQRQRRANLTCRVSSFVTYEAVWPRVLAEQIVRVSGSIGSAVAEREVHFLS
jgi:hypothetical protein